MNLYDTPFSFPFPDQNLLFCVSVLMHNGGLSNGCIIGFTILKLFLCKKFYVLMKMKKSHYIFITFIFYHRAVVKQDRYMHDTFAELFCIAGQCRNNPWTVPDWPRCRNADVGLTQLTNCKNADAGLTFFQAWATLHPSELRWTLLSYTAHLSYTAYCYPAPYWASLHPFFELRYILRATQHLLTYATPHWAALHSTELRCSKPWGTLLSIPAP